MATIEPNWQANDDGIVYSTQMDGSPAKPWISTEHFGSGSHSIGFQVPTDTSGNKERFEYVIAQATDADGLHFDNSRYSGFVFQLTTNSAPFLNSVIFWQAWQGSPWGPPAMLKFAASSSPPYTLRLTIRNMNTGPDSATSDLQLWRSNMIYPGTWYVFVIYLEPRYNSSGNIKLWINGTNYLDWSGPIGYDPVQVSNTYNGLVLKNGMYQPNANNGHTFYFDQITLAGSYAEAAGLATNPPRIGNITLQGTRLSLGGSGGVANAGYRVLTATNAALPRSNWTLLRSGAFATNGTFSFSNSLIPTKEQSFYMLTVP